MRLSSHIVSGYHCTSLTRDLDMGEKRYQVPLPEEIQAAFGWEDADVPERVREALAMELVRLGRISSGRAAELLGISRWDAMDLMAKYQVSAIQLSSEEVKQEASAWSGRR